MTDLQKWQLEQQCMDIRATIAFQQSQLKQSIASGFAALNSQTAIPTGPYMLQLCQNQNYHAHQQIPNNCPNCGAPVRKNTCEYCGTRFN